MLPGRISRCRTGRICLSRQRRCWCPDRRASSCQSCPDAVEMYVHMLGYPAHLAPARINNSGSISALEVKGADLTYACDHLIHTTVLEFVTFTVYAGCDMTIFWLARHVVPWVVLLDLFRKALHKNSFAVIFGDTKMEFPDIYKVIDELEKDCRDDGIEFYRASSHFESDKSCQEQ